MSRDSRKGDSKRFYDWIYHAWLDRMSAQELMNNKELYLVAAFHCQQCIEKGLKGYLLFKSGRLPDGHNLTWLCKQAALLDDSFIGWIDESAVLNRYYIETRYPADIPLELDGNGCRTLVDMSLEIMDYICEVTGFDFRSYHKKNIKKQNE